MLTLTWLATTLLCYAAGSTIARATGGNGLANPTAIAILLVATIVTITQTSYETYFVSTWPLTFLLIPGTVALGVPLARHLRSAGREVVAIALASTCGSLAAMLVGVVVVRLFGGDRTSMLAILPKAATSPVAMAISQQIGGHPNLTASLSIVGGILAAITLSAVIGASRMPDWRALGLAAGTGGSGIAAAQLVARNESAAAFAAIGIAICAAVSALCAPIVAAYIR